MKATMRKITRQYDGHRRRVHTMAVKRWSQWSRVAVLVPLICGQSSSALAAPKKKAGDTAPKALTEQVAPSTAERTSAGDVTARGIVVVERGGQQIGLGAVLASDGRVLSALSSLGAGNDLSVRYADGTTAMVRLRHHDRAWDLALLVPQSGLWREGLIASSRDPIRPNASIRVGAVVKGRPSTAGITLIGKRVLLGADDKRLEDALELTGRVSASDLGAPLLDEEGRVVGVVARACAPNPDKPCTPVAFGAPLSAIKNFLRTVPPNATVPAAWLGIQGVAEIDAVAKGVRVTGVHPQSPAHAAQLKASESDEADIVVAIRGDPVTSPEDLSSVLRNHGAGEKVDLLILRAGKYLVLPVELRAAPDSVGMATGKQSE